MTPLCQSLQIDVFRAELKLGFQASEPCGLLFALVQEAPGPSPDGVAGCGSVEADLLWLGMALC